MTTRAPSRAAIDALADGRHGAEQDPARVGLGVVHLAPRRDDLDDRAAIASGSPPERSRISRNEVESRQSRSTATSISKGRTGPEGSSRSAGWGSDPPGLEHPVRTEPVRELPSDSIFMNDR